MRPSSSAATSTDTLHVGAHWKDVVSTWPDPPGWRALEVAVTVPARPGLVVQAGPRRVRLAIGPRPIAWARMHRDHMGTTTLVAREVGSRVPLFHDGHVSGEARRVLCGRAHMSIA